MSLLACWSKESEMRKTNREDVLYKALESIYSGHLPNPPKREKHKLTVTVMKQIALDAMSEFEGKPQEEIASRYE